MKTLLVGFGNISKFYVAYFINKKMSFSILSRTKKDISQEASTFIDKFYTHIDQVNLSDYEYIIIASPIETLFDYTKLFLSQTNAKVLCEKPGFLTEDLEQLKNHQNQRLFYAFNRRFYDNTQTINAFLNNKDNRQILINATIDERIKFVEKSKKSELVKKHWLMANTSHVIDLVLFSIGYSNLNFSNFTFRQMGIDELKWHPSGNCFISTYCDSNLAINFYGLWNGDGGWSVAAKTNLGSLNLTNLETLVTPEGKEQIESDKIKPGFTKMLDAFYSDNTDKLCKIDELLQLKEFVFRLGGYE